MIIIFYHFNISMCCIFRRFDDGPGSQPFSIPKRKISAKRKNLRAQSIDYNGHDRLLNRRWSYGGDTCALWLQVLSYIAEISKLNVGRYISNSTFLSNSEQHKCSNTNDSISVHKSNLWANHHCHNIRRVLCQVECNYDPIFIYFYDVSSKSIIYSGTFKSLRANE